MKIVKISKKQRENTKMAQDSNQVTIFDLVDDWENEGYGIALISPDHIIMDPYVDPSDYPDMFLSKSGNGAVVLDGEHKGCYILFHSGQLEGKTGETLRK